MENPKSGRSKHDARYESAGLSSSSITVPAMYEHQDATSTNGASSITPNSERERGGRQTRPREVDEIDRVGPVHKKQKIALPKGLLNLSSACFSNVSLQLIDATLTPVEVAQFSNRSVLEESNFDARALDQSQGKRPSDALAELNQDINKSPPLKLAPYIGKVLEDMRSNDESVADPRLFQRAFAFGSANGSHEVFSGDTQEDASEYLRLLISTLGEEHGLVNDAFQYRMAEAIVCMAPGCQYRNDLAAENGTLLEVPISVATRSPSLRSSRRKLPTYPPTTLDHLIAAHFRNTMCEGSTCETCKAKDTVARQSKMTEYPNHLLISVNRTKSEQASGRGGSAGSRGVPVVKKDTTEVKLNFGDIRIGEDGVYQLIALVKHSGSRAGNGHYSAYRKVDDDKWAFLDDDVIKLVGERNLDDGVKGFSSILLLKRQPQKS